MELKSTFLSVWTTYGTTQRSTPRLRPIVFFLEEFRKSLKASLMAKQLGEPVNAMEMYAYAHHEYTLHLEGVKEAIEEEENLRWKLIAAQAKISVWQSLGANSRAEAKAL